MVCVIVEVEELEGGGVRSEGGVMGGMGELGVSLACEKEREK